MAIDNASNQYHLTCNSGGCQCCQNLNCSDIGFTAAEVCQTTTTVRDMLIEMCTTGWACTDTCPSTPPQNLAGCNAMNIGQCSYNSGVTCACQPGVNQFMCIGN
jgi:hypothetical protein